jgi:hypothetical protein
MSDGQKFCAACGSAAEETLAKAVCGGCHAEGAGDQKFCAQCGEPLAKAADFDAGMAALDDLSVSNVGCNCGVRQDAGETQPGVSPRRGRDGLDLGPRGAFVRSPM